jgi:hypothetical protein
MDKKSAVQSWCAGVSSGRSRLLARLPRRRLPPQVVAAAVNAYAGVSGEGAARAFSDGRVSLAVTESGQVVGVLGRRHIITVKKDGEQ